jgi:HSP20 family molecular chaperone IbpA
LTPSDELTLSVGSYRRNIALPRVLWPLEVASAKLDNGILTLRFIAQEGI